MALIIKPNAGVSMAGMQPQTSVGMVIVAGVFETYGLDCIVTSITDGQHKRHSLHKKGLAFDARKWEVLEDGRFLFLQQCSAALGKEWQCLEGDLNFHFEWDPE